MNEDTKTTRTAFPLHWPIARPRCTTRKTNRQFRTTFANARDDCLLEIKRLGGSEVMISTNIPLRRDGVPQAKAWGETLKDPGVAVYFKRKGKELCFACDAWYHVQDNMHAICLTISALRGIARWGTGDMMEAAFTGFRALPAPGQTSGANWWQVLGVPVNAGADQVKSAYRLLAAKHHPDRNGDRELWDRLQSAYEQFERMQKVTA